MNSTEKTDLCIKIGNCLEKKYDKSEEITQLLLDDNFSLQYEDGDFGGSYFNIHRTLMRGGKDKLIAIAQSLKIDITPIAILPKNCESTTNVKAFITHLAKDKKYATRMRDALKKHNIDCFVAHEDIKPSKEWQSEIINALDSMDFFISIHTKDIDESSFCQQEIGYALARDVFMIAVTFDGETPAGFLASKQAIVRNGKQKAEDIADQIIGLLENEPSVKDLLAKIYDDNLPF